MPSLIPDNFLQPMKALAAEIPLKSFRGDEFLYDGKGIDLDSSDRWKSTGPRDPYVDQMEYLRLQLVRDRGTFDAFNRPTSPSSENWAFDRSWEHCHKGFAIFLSGNPANFEKGLEALSCATRERVIADSGMLIRAGVCVRQLLRDGQIEEAAKICALCEFTAEERGLLYRLALKDRFESPETSRIYLKPVATSATNESTPSLLSAGDCARTLCCPIDLVESHARHAYLDALEAHSYPARASRVMAQRAQSEDSWLKLKIDNAQLHWNQKDLSLLRSNIVNPEVLDRESAALATAISCGDFGALRQLCGMRVFSLNEPRLQAVTADLSATILKCAAGNRSLDADTLATIASKIGLPEALRTDPAVREMAYHLAIESTQYGGLKTYREIADYFNLKEFPRSQSIEERLARTVVNLGAQYGACPIIEEFSMLCPPAQDYINAAVHAYITTKSNASSEVSGSPLFRFQNLEAAFGIPQRVRTDPLLVEYAQKHALDALRAGQLAAFQGWHDCFAFESQFLTSEAFYACWCPAIARAIMGDFTSIEDCREFLRQFPAPQSYLDAALPAEYIKAILGPRQKGATYAAETWPHILNHKIEDIIAQLPERDAQIVAACGLSTIYDLKKLSEVEPQLIGYYAKEENKGIAPSLTAENAAKAAALGVPLLHAEIFLRHGQSLSLFEQYPRLLALCSEIKTNPQTEIADTEGLARGMDTFGPEYMIQFMTPAPGSTRGINVHAPLQEIDAIIKLYKGSGLDQKEFFFRFLDKVRRDGSHYEIGDAHTYFTVLARGVNLDITERLKIAETFSDLRIVQELAATFRKDPDLAWNSWHDFQRYCKLDDAIGQGEVLETLKQLKALGRESEARFIELIGFHSTSRVSGSTLKQFCEDFPRFLGEPDTTAASLDSCTSPRSYTTVPYLDLSADDLRQALSDGRLDRLQQLPPLSLKISLPVNTEKYQNLRESLRLALGSRSANIPGEAKDVGMLFKQCSAVLKSEGISVQEYLAGSVPSSEAQAKLMTLVFRSPHGLHEPLQDLFATIQQKSNPYGILAGNDTACCMPFGSRKNTSYMFNPSCAIFTLQLARQEGGYRTITQSLTRLDRQLNEAAAVSSTLPQTETDIMNSLVTGEADHDRPLRITCDNAEPNKNYCGQEWRTKNRIGYQTFFSEYLRIHGADLGVSGDYVGIGRGYSLPFSHHAETAVNSFVPTVLIPYSDMTGSTVYRVNTVAEPAFPFEVRSAPYEPHGPAVNFRTPGVRELDVRDIQPIALVEAAAYKDTELGEGLFEMQRTIVASLTSAAIKNRPNMSFVNIGEGGALNGYLIAYQGSAGTSEQSVESQILYVADVAADPAHLGAGPKLLKRFLDSYEEQYLAEGKNIPILADMREPTTYAFVSKRLNQIAKARGIEFKFTEVAVSGNGDDRRHTVLMTPHALNVTATSTALE